jgi:hypothetical protein
MITAVYRKGLPHIKIINNLRVSMFLIWRFQHKIHEHLKFRYFYFAFKTYAKYRASHKYEKR